MFDNILKFFKKMIKKENQASNSKDTAKERLHLVLLQDRANVSADFLDLMKQEIIEVIKKYIEIDESAIDVRLTNKENSDGTNGAPALYANIPILNIKEETRKIANKEEKTEKEHEEVKKEADNDEAKKENEEEKEENITEDINKENENKSEEQNENQDEKSKVEEEKQEETKKEEESESEKSDNEEINE